MFWVIGAFCFVGLCFISAFYSIFNYPGRNLYLARTSERFAKRTHTSPLSAITRFHHNTSSLQSDGRNGQPACGNYLL